MLSFNDSYEYHDLRQASYLDTGFYGTPQLDMGPASLHSSDLIDDLFPLPSRSPPAHARISERVDDGTHYATVLTAPRPLLLPNSRQRSPSEFQSSGLFSYDSHGCSADNNRRPTNGLGLHFGYERRERGTATAALSAGGLAHSLSTSDGMLFNLLDSSPTYLTMSDPFDDPGAFLVVSEGFTQSDMLADRKQRHTPTAPTVSILPLSTAKYEAEEFSCGMTFSSSITSSFSGADRLTSLPGLVADINMFDKGDSDSGMFVRPQDLIGNCEQLQRPGSPLISKFEDTSDTPATSTPTHLPQTSWFLLPEHLQHGSGLFVSQFPQHEHSSRDSIVDCQNMIQALKQDETSASKLITQSSLFPAHVPPPITAVSPITAEILDTVEGGDNSAPPTKARKRLADKTNVPRPRVSVRTSGNILDTYGGVIPRDVPLMDPHEGISGEDVAQKAKHFMMMNPGDKLSDELLFSFAGRLSVTGGPIAGYRCYISGCTKITKRKDHMGDHIRTHLGEKPFQCGICGLGFIRNNDCQRHENNHRPDKKFGCECGAAFSRRDLFVRHQKTACSLSTDARGFVRRPRKYMKTSRKATPDGDDPNDLDYMR
ncbi:hypothetical protein DFH11DRAFT_1566971 [Phellopilus nigrolimitatus]|nr:hypothetical protein DFH11DRAFT_1566971 [Phellopilus nigrolimitatus]